MNKPEIYINKPRTFLVIDAGLKPWSESCNLDFVAYVRRFVASTFRQPERIQITSVTVAVHE